MYIKKTNFKSYLQPKVLIPTFATLVLLMIYQFVINIPAPGVKVQYKAEYQNILSLLNMMTGGGLKKASFFAVGIAPYITSQIIIQILSNDIVKKLSNIKKEGEKGRIKLEFYTRILTLPFAFLTAFGTLMLLTNNPVLTFHDFSGNPINNISEMSAFQKAFYIFYFVSGTYMALFFADIISKKGIGNGITILIMSGIIVGIPEHFIKAWKSFEMINFIFKEEHYFLVILKFIIYSVLYIFVFWLVIILNGAVRKIPVQQTGQGISENKKELPFLPIKLITAGVIPVIFAGSIMVIPEALTYLIQGIKGQDYNVGILKNLNLNHPLGIFVYGLLIILLSFFYSQLQLNPEEISNNFLRSGRFIPGIRSKENTALYISKAISYMNWIGAPFLAIIATLPNIISLMTGLPSSIAMGGTGVVILVSGSIQIWESIKSISISSDYKMHSNNIQKKLFKEEKSKKILLW